MAYLHTCPTYKDSKPVYLVREACIIVNNTRVSVAAVGEGGGGLRIDRLTNHRYAKSTHVTPRGAISSRCDVLLFTVRLLIWMTSLLPLRILFEYMCDNGCRLRQTFVNGTCTSRQLTRAHFSLLCRKIKQLAPNFCHLRSLKNNFSTNL